MEKRIWEFKYWGGNGLNSCVLISRSQEKNQPNFFSQQMQSLYIVVVS